MKSITLICIYLSLSSVCHAATWVLEIIDQQTSEVRTFKYSEAKKHGLILPGVDIVSCMLTINDIKAGAGGPDSPPLQLAEVLCAGDQMGFAVRNICQSTPGSEARAVHFQVIQPEKKLKNKKKSKFKSYGLMLSCE